MWMLKWPGTDKHLQDAWSQISNSLDTAKNKYTSTRLLTAKSLKSRCTTLKSIGTTKPSFPSPYNYFTPEDLSRHFAATVNRHPAITRADFDSILHSPLNLPRNILLFSFSPITQTKTQTALKQLSAKSMVHDAKSQQMLKLVSLTITPPLTSIWNCSFNTSTFPSYWKKALINPLLKTMTPLTNSDTRPIAILPELSKIL